VVDVATAATAMVVAAVRCDQRSPHDITSISVEMTHLNLNASLPEVFHKSSIRTCCRKCRLKRLRLSARCRLRCKDGPQLANRLQPEPVLIYENKNPSKFKTGKGGRVV
jgi:hypothetical protein